MKQKLLTDIELDVQELKCLMDAFSKEPTATLSELLKRNITHMHAQLDALAQEVERVADNQPASLDNALLTVESLTESAPEEEACTAPPVVEEVAASGRPAILGDNIKLFTGELRKSISLNDSFRFSRELFGGDTALMNRVIEQISVMSSYKSALAFLSSKIELDEEQEAVADFLELLKKYFNQSI